MMMNKWIRRSIITLLFSLMTVATVAAQALDCAALFQAAAQSAGDHCAGLDRNQVCLGAGTAVLETQPDYSGVTFAQPGDVIDAAAIASLTTSGTDADYALVVARLQLNQPAESDHSSVMLLLGNITLNAAELPLAPGLPLNDTREVVPDSPLTALEFTSQPGPCNDAVPNGLVIQSPNLTTTDAGYRPTTIHINSWDFVLGSTVLIETGADGSTIMKVLEHFAEVGSGDGSALVLVGENIQLPPGTPFVGNEDGSLVVIGSGRQAVDEAGSGFDLLNDLFGNEKIGNRSVPPAPAPNTGGGSTGTAVVSGVVPAPIVPDGLWHYGVGLSSTFGECIMSGFNVTETTTIITLDEFINYDGDGELLGYVWLSMGTSSILPFDEITPGVYVAEDRSPIGSTLIEVEVITRYALAVTITQTLDGPGGICFIETPILIQSCLFDVFYDRTDGTGLCPPEAHQAMGTF